MRHFALPERVLYWGRPTSPGDTSNRCLPFRLTLCGIGAGLTAPLLRLGEASK